MVVVFDEPMNRIARQSILACKSRETVVFQPTQSTFGGGPERTVTIEPNVVNSPFSQSIRDSIGCLDLTVLEVSQATVKKTNPYPPSHRIGSKGRSKVLMSELVPRKLLDQLAPAQMKQTEILISNPQIASIVLTDGTTNSARNAIDRNKPVVLQISERVLPDAP